MSSSGGSHEAENLRKRQHCAAGIAASQSPQNAHVNARRGRGGRIHVRSWTKLATCGAGYVLGLLTIPRLSFPGQTLSCLVPELSGINRTACCHVYVPPGPHHGRVISPSTLPRTAYTYPKTASQRTPCALSSNTCALMLAVTYRQFSDSPHKTSPPARLLAAQS
jgi:hypothetical protein